MSHLIGIEAPLIKHEGSFYYGFGWVESLFNAVEDYKHFTKAIDSNSAIRLYSSNDKAVGVVSYQLATLKDLGVTLPVLDLVEFNLGYHVGYGRIQLNDGMDNGNNEVTHGPSLTLLNIKF